MKINSYNTMKLQYLFVIKKVFYNTLILTFLNLCSSVYRDIISLQEHRDGTMFEHQGASGAVQSLMHNHQP